MCLCMPLRFTVLWSYGMLCRRGRPVWLVFPVLNNLPIYASKEICTEAVFCGVQCSAIVVRCSECVAARGEGDCEGKSTCDAW